MSSVTAKNLAYLVDKEFGGIGRRAERALGISQNSIPRYLPNKIEGDKEPYTPTDRILEKILELGYNLNWFLFDKGPERFSQISSITGGIRLVPGRLQGNYINTPNLEHFLTGLGLYRIPGVEDAENSQIFEVTSDTMSPTILQGDWVVCRKRQNASGWVLGGVYLLVGLKKGIFIGRLCGDPNNLKSYPMETERKEKITIPESEIREVWEVYSIITQNVPSYSEVNKKIDHLEDDFSAFKKKISKYIFELTGNENVIEDLK